jgi:hypothetical protein
MAFYSSYYRRSALTSYSVYRVHQHLYAYVIRFAQSRLLSGDVDGLVSADHSPEINLQTVNLQQQRNHGSLLEVHCSLHQQVHRDIYTQPKQQQQQQSAIT